MEYRVQVLRFDKAASVGGKGPLEVGALAVASPTVTSQLHRINQFGQGKMLEEGKQTRS